jgi:hypothetical protein
MFRQGKYPFVVFCFVLAVLALALVSLPFVTNAVPPPPFATGFTNIDPPGCTTEATATGINEVNWISGACENSDEHPYIRRGDGTLFIPTPLPPNSISPTDGDADDVNDNLDILITIFATDGLDHIWVRNGATHAYTEVKGLPPNDGFPDGNGLNESDQVVGTYEDCLPTCYTTHAFSWSKGVAKKLTVPGSVDTEANGNNEEGDIVGSFHGTDNVDHCFLLEDGVYSTIDVTFAGATETVCYGISDFGDIVGSYEDATFNEHGFVLRAGVFYPVDVSITGATDTVVRRINEGGWIVGTYVDASNKTHAFKAKVPASTAGEELPD